MEPDEVPDLGARRDSSNTRPTELFDAVMSSLSTATVRTVSLPPVAGSRSPWPDWVDPDVVTALRGAGIARPWRHQVEAADAARAGRHTVVATGTASGKSVAYWMPVLSAICGDGATALYCTPTKALAQDQLTALNTLSLHSVRAAAYDGDTAPEARPWIRRHANYVHTNPEMLHRAILPGHELWRSFLRRLRFIVLDECHTYRGVFGSHMAAVVRRLRRVALHHGSSPVVLAASATMRDPASSTSMLIGDPVTSVTRDASARPGTSIVLAEVDSTRIGPFRQACDTLTALTRSGARTLAFVASRSGAELMATAVRDSLPAHLSARVTAYRGGLLPEERRGLERRLRNGELLTAVSTNALELGIDVAGLDAVVLCGWPGTRVSFLQRIGRAGRGDRQALAVLIGQDDPLDRYFVRNPDRLLGDPVEATVLDPRNPYVLAPHLAAAAAEIPLSDADAAHWFGDTASALLPRLARLSLVRRRPTGWHWTARGRPGDLADLRGNSAAAVSIVEGSTGRVLGTVDDTSAPFHVHPGAVYVHLGKTYLVESLELTDGVAIVRRADPGYDTTANSISRLRIVRGSQSRQLGAGGVHFGDVEVTSQVVGFRRRRSGTGEFLGAFPLVMPERRLRTQAVWWLVPNGTLGESGITESVIPGAVHAAEHAAIAMLPALATCDRWDIAGLSSASHPDTETATVFVYDGHEGGVGLARSGFERIEEWLRTTRVAVSACDCLDGCPRCVQSPKCGNGNEPLDKAGALSFLALLVGAANEASPPERSVNPGPRTHRLPQPLPLLPRR